MNNVILIGRLTKDPDIKYSQSNEPMCIARYTLAVERRGKKVEGQPNADFISCVAFGKNGEFSEKYLKKGMKIAIGGHIQTGSYTNNQGVKVYTTDVIVDAQEFVESKGTTETTKSPETATPSASGDGFMNIPDGIDEELPFN